MAAYAHKHTPFKNINSIKCINRNIFITIHFENDIYCILSSKTVFKKLKH